MIFFIVFEFEEYLQCSLNTYFLYNIVNFYNIKTKISILNSNYTLLGFCVWYFLNVASLFKLLYQFEKQNRPCDIINKCFMFLLAMVSFLCCIITPGMDFKAMLLYFTFLYFSDIHHTLWSSFMSKA